MLLKIAIVILLLYVLPFVKGINNEVHGFFYLWYGNPENNGQYQHWNHEILPHWEDRINDLYKTIGQRYSPPDSIHSPYYPLRGPYSSKNPTTLQQQFDDCNRAGINTIVISWWGKKNESYATDTQGVNTDLIMHDVFTAAEKDRNEIKIAIHLEPYPSRTAATVKDDVAYIIENYGNYTSFYRHNGKPLFYVYDSYHILPHQWSDILKKESDNTLRNTNIDAIFLGLWLDSHHGRDLADSGFDGIYTYFSSDGFSYGSTIRNFPMIVKFCQKNSLICNLSIGPGYDDTKIRPWNHQNTKGRKDGNYYKNMFEKAIASKPNMISISTFNEWGEGTQIEPAVDKVGYLDYGEAGSYKYIDITKQYVNEFLKDNEL